MQAFDKWLAEIEQEIKDYKEVFGCRCYPHWLMRRKAQVKGMQEVFSRTVSQK